MKAGGGVVIGVVLGAFLAWAGAERVIALLFQGVYLVMAFFVLRGVAWGFTRLQLRGENR